MVIFHRNSGSLAGYPGCNRNHQIWCFNVFPQSIPQAVDFPWKNIKKKSSSANRYVINGTNLSTSIFSMDWFAWEN